MRLFSAFLVLATLVVPKPASESSMSQAARRFVASLSEPLREKAVLPAASADRDTWTYVPGGRRGVSWSEMDGTQRKAAVELLRASLSPEGFEKVEKIRSLESVLAEMEKNPSRDPEKYWFVFFGEPSATGPWLWRYEGHHVSLTFGHTGGIVVSSTPQFLGSNPAEVRSGPLKGQRVLAKEQDLAFRLVDSFRPEQRRKAVLSEEAPTDIVTGSSRQAGIDGRSGLPYDDMDKGQKALLRQLLDVHSSVQQASERSRRMKAVQADGYGHVVFAWLGPVRRDARHYYRIQSDTFVVEYDNTQADGNHIHTVWRDFKGDFGRDALADHYEHGHHHHD
ncbi:MAG: DUF3500 domain-containing protein [Armatimonadetes bacterium]|nr:DUF3500 domain-containing protein [Armatimonadota bacterium]